jgi:hypothetical protein
VTTRFATLAGRFARPANALAAAGIAAVALAALAAFGDARLVAGALLIMGLAVLGGLAVTALQVRRLRADLSASNRRTEVAYRRILAAIESERLAAERRHADCRAARD